MDSMGDNTSEKYSFWDSYGIVIIWIGMLATLMHLMGGILNNLLEMFPIA